MSIIAMVLDNETTGFTLPSVADDSKQPRIIEFGAAKIDVLANERIGEINLLINPGMQVSDKITEITGITNEALVGKPLFKDVAPQIIEFFKGVTHVIAHNANFDVQMLKMDAARAGCLDAFEWNKKTIICTVQEYVHVFGRRPKLTELYEHFMKKPLAQTHRALDDVNALIEILDTSGFWVAL